jgi:hypothetical protein
VSKVIKKIAATKGEAVPKKALKIAATKGEAVPKKALKMDTKCVVSAYTVIKSPGVTCLRG